jgi:hypothetical protein
VAQQKQTKDGFLSHVCILELMIEAALHSDCPKVILKAAMVIITNNGFIEALRDLKQHGKTLSIDANVVPLAD